MVNRSSILPTERISFFPYEEDVTYLRAKYGTGSAKMGYGPAMREIIHAAVKKLREKERLRLDQAIQPITTMNLSEVEDVLNTPK